MKAGELFKDGEVDVVKKSESRSQIKPLLLAFTTRLIARQTTRSWWSDYLYPTHLPHK